MKSFEEVLSLANLPHVHQLLILTDEVSQADISWNGDTAYIRINKVYFNRFTDNVFVAAICHELGHAKLFHQGMSDVNKEIDADVHCGYLMRRLGYNKLDEALQVVATASDSASSIYPSKAVRRQSIERGWRLAERKANLLANIHFNPRIVWELESNDALVVCIDDRRVVFTIRYNHALVYDTVSGATIHLLNYRNRIGAYGVGRLITNRTAVVYIRRGTNGYSVYEKGEELTLSNCKRGDGYGYIIDGNLPVNCYFDVYGDYMKFLLKDYEYAPEEYPMPAFPD